MNKKEIDIQLENLIKNCKAGKVIRSSDGQKLTEPRVKNRNGDRYSFDFTVTSKRTGKTSRQDYWVDVFSKYVTILP